MKDSPSRHEVWKMFDQISGTYDRTNRILSLGLDVHWRKKVAKLFPRQDSIHFLDLACGTGDQIYSVFDECKGKHLSAIGIDLSKEMLKVGQEKLEKKNYRDQVLIQEGDAENIPFKDNSFDTLTMSFGIRNVTDLGRCFFEMLRVLKTDGRALILEFALPNRILRPFYLFYLRHILPWIGKAISKHSFAYQYLNRTIETFPSGTAFSSLMKDAGFSKVEIHSLSFGTVNLYVGYK